ncbi:hypothetical protein BJV78DRAFT_1209800 [Lactifluus subvellereus]|nr:hypothetical protein BJV78DRAFT_1209800 [Lactifluus subvellereus]
MRTTYRLIPWNTGVYYTRSPAHAVRQARGTAPPAGAAVAKSMAGTAQTTPGGWDAAAADPPPRGPPRSLWLSLHVDVCGSICMPGVQARTAPATAATLEVPPREHRHDRCLLSPRPSWSCLPASDAIVDVAISWPSGKYRKVPQGLSWVSAQARVKRCARDFRWMRPK